MLRLLAISALLGATPLSLEDAMTRATNTNPLVRAANADAARAATIDKQAIALFLPQIEARSTFQYNDDKIVFGPAGPNQFVLQPWWQLNWQVTASQNLSLYGPAIPLYRQARAATRAAGALESAARQDVTFAVARAYYAGLEAEALADVARDAEKAAEELLRQTAGRREAGRATEAEVLRAKLRVAESASVSATARRGATEAHETLADLLGDHSPFDLSRPARPVLPSDVESGDSALSFVRRPDLRAANEAVEGTVDARAAAARAWYPTLTVTGLYSGYTTSNGDTFGQNPSRTALVGVATVPLWDGNLKYWQLREKREAENAARARASVAEASAGADLRRARRALAAARESETLSKERLGLAQKARDLVEGQFSVGAITQLEILDADSALAAAKRESISGELEADVAALDLKHALGLPLTGAKP